MLKHVYPIFFICIVMLHLAASCEHDDDFRFEKEIDINRIEMDIINSTLPVLTPRNKSLGYIDVVTEGIDDQQQDSLIKSIISEQKRVVDSLGWFLHLYDSFDVYNEAYLSVLEEHYSCDLSKFKDNTMKAKQIDLKQVNTFKNITVVSYREKMGNDYFRLLGKVSYSHILFNENYTKAEFFYEYSNGICAEGHKSYYVRVIKVLGSWIIIGV